MRVFSIIKPLFVSLLCVTGCGMPSSGTHTVSSDQNSFAEEIDGRKIEYQNWTISVDGGKGIPIEKTKSVIRIDTTASGKVEIYVNKKKVHDDKTITSPAS